MHTLREYEHCILHDVTMSFTPDHKVYPYLNAVEMTNTQLLFLRVTARYLHNTNEKLLLTFTINVSNLSNHLNTSLNTCNHLRNRNRMYTISMFIVPYQR